MHPINYVLVRYIVDVIVVAFLVYRGLLMVRGTRSAPMLFGLSLVVLLHFLSTYLELLTVNWLLGKFFDSIILLVVVIFQEEIRRALTKVGLQPLMGRTSSSVLDSVVEDVTLAATKLAKAGLGAIIVLQGEVGLDDIVADATRMDALLSRKLLYSLFVKDSPLHDGAVIVAGERIRAAGAVLPLSYNPDLDPSLGTRHRAALGLSEQRDALIVVVSEETASVSIARDSALQRNLSADDLRGIIGDFLDSSDAGDAQEEEVE